MLVWYWFTLVILLVLLCLSCIKITIMQKSAAEIEIAFHQAIHEETNVLISLSSRDPHMIHLAEAMNNELRHFRYERQRYNQGDTELKAAVTNIAHDLRTPLTAISGYLQLLDKPTTIDQEKQYLDLIRNRTEALKTLSEELFKYSVIQTQTDLKLEKLSLKSVLEESLLSMYGLLHERGVIPTIQLVDSPVERNLDPLALSRIFENIISNVLKYSDGDFDVHMSEDGLITFSNTAENLDHLFIGRLFDRFYTVESGQQATGLGLNISKLLTERMNGSISATYINRRLSIHVYFPS